MATAPESKPKDPFAARRSQLETRLAALTERIEAIRDELGQHQSKDWEEMATEREEDEVLEGMGASARAEAMRIRAALERMDEDDYGTCMRCGAEIDPRRLDLLPDTPLCSACARAASGPTH
ncbi:TraR/DksA family transcriptional regulator [Acidimangrovimonas sediminis]|uniref:TraR/DksA family transcriptional regulator n=1 Tax=Acidimangrovimonas sediminis TaxID=2056283 RepID=UPI000C7F7E91|nr:TraR/DksA C4-type zinc finger protein [Acidimangrovimonas sediminis]